MRKIRSEDVRKVARRAKKYPSKSGWGYAETLDPDKEEKDATGYIVSADEFYKQGNYTDALEALERAARAGRNVHDESFYATFPDAEIDEDKYFKMVEKRLGKVWKKLKRDSVESYKAREVSTLISNYRDLRNAWRSGYTNGVWAHKEDTDTKNVLERLKNDGASEEVLRAYQRPPRRKGLETDVQSLVPAALTIFGVIGAAIFFHTMLQVM